MRAPFNYYGGKARMLNHIFEIMPPHNSYSELFAGGLAFFFAKPQSASEYINDVNGNVTAFYRMAKSKPKQLIAEIECVLHCEHTFKQARNVYHAKSGKTQMQRAVAFWICINQSFASEAGGTWNFTQNPGDSYNPAHGTKIKKQLLHAACARLEKTVILNRRAEDVILKIDRPDMLHYLDPPYFGVSQGHYKGYTENDFAAILSKLTKLKGKFILSSYKSGILDEFCDTHQWHQTEVSKGSDMSKKVSKIEVLTYNFTNPQLSLF